MEKKNKIKVYTDNSHSDKKEWRNFLIHPIKAFWGDGTRHWYNHKSNFTFYKRFFKICDKINKADVAFLPLTLNYYLKTKQLFLVKDFINHVDENNLKTYIWIDGDNQIRYMDQNKNCIFVKYFSKKSKFLKNELIQPGDLKRDVLKQYLDGKIKIKNKSKIPIIGFDGLANYSKIKLSNIIIKNIVLKLLYNLKITIVNQDHIIPSLIKRKNILKILNNSKLIKTNFNIRDIFAAGTIGGKKKSRSEFIDNILSSDYTFCYRGAANYSLRFYETLCLGRIPLFVDTDCKLPFEKEIDWKSICIWVNKDDIEYIPELILDFHNSHSESKFIEKQMYCREIWLKYLSKKGFYNQFYNNLKNECFNV